MSVYAYGRYIVNKGRYFLKLRVILLKITKIFLTKGHSASSARGFDRIKLGAFYQLLLLPLLWQNITRLGHSISLLFGGPLLMVSVLFANRAWWTTESY
jgi:hypothetical protein